MGQGCSSMVEHLRSTHKALGPVHRRHKTKKWSWKVRWQQSLYCWRLSISGPSSALRLVEDHVTDSHGMFHQQKHGQRKSHNTDTWYTVCVLCEPDRRPVEDTELSIGEECWKLMNFLLRCCFSNLRSQARTNTAGGAKGAERRWWLKREVEFPQVGRRWTPVTLFTRIRGSIWQDTNIE